MTAGVAFSETGVARAGMGTDAGDYDGSGRPSLVVGNFSTEMMALYHNEGNGLFIDEAPAGAIGKASSLSLTFACFFFDYDLDGLLDIFAVNGHVSDDIEKVQPKVKYAQPPAPLPQPGRQALRGGHGGRGRGPARCRSSAAAPPTATTTTTATSTSSSRPTTAPRACCATTAGTATSGCACRRSAPAANRDGIGARVTVTTPDGKKQWALVKTGSVYCVAERAAADVRARRRREGRRRSR